MIIQSEYCCEGQRSREKNKGSDISHIDNRYGITNREYGSTFDADEGPDSNSSSAGCPFSAKNRSNQGGRTSNNSYSKTLTEAPQYLNYLDVSDNSRLVPSLSETSNINVNRLWRMKLEDDRAVDGKVSSQTGDNNNNNRSSSNSSNVTETENHQVKTITADDKNNNNISINDSSYSRNSSESSNDNSRDVLRYSRQEVANHCYEDSCWLIINNKVYDVTEYVSRHPGGDEIVMEYGGYDATCGFLEKGHSKRAFKKLEEYCIGQLVQEDWLPEVH